MNEFKSAFYFFPSSLSLSLSMCVCVWESAQSASGPLSATLSIEQTNFSLHYLPQKPDGSKVVPISESIDEYYDSLTNSSTILDVRIHVDVPLSC